MHSRRDGHCKDQAMNVLLWEGGDSGMRGRNEVWAVHRGSEINRLSATADGCPVLVF